MAPSTHCVRWGPSSPKRGTAPQFLAMSIVAKRSPMSATAELLYARLAHNATIYREITAEPATPSFWFVRLDSSFLRRSDRFQCPRLLYCPFPIPCLSPVPPLPLLFTCLFSSFPLFPIALVHLHFSSCILFQPCPLPDAFRPPSLPCLPVEIHGHFSIIV